MIFKALACDFDGTLASGDRLHPEAIAALLRAREAGLRVFLVTGRTFFELVRVCERLDLFDAVVAENGAVLYFPDSAVIRDQGPPRPTGYSPSSIAGASATRSAASSWAWRGATSARCARRSARPE